MIFKISKMDFLQQIKNEKNKLRSTETLITSADGNCYYENTEMRRIGLDPKKIEDSEKKYGFVVDTKPDSVPVNITRGLFIGSQDCTDESILEAYQFTHVLSVGVHIDLSDRIESKFVDCLDLPETDIRSVLNETNIFIKDALSNNAKLLVHCNAGVSRAATVIIGYLIIEEKYTFCDAYNLVKTNRPCIQPNAGFLRQLEAM